MTDQQQKDLLALAKRAQAGEQEAMDEVRVRVAKALGWEDVALSQFNGLLCGYPAGTHTKSSTYIKRVPNWPTDIAAAFELGEEAKKRGRHLQFWQAISNMTRPDKGDTPLGPNFFTRQAAAHCFRAIQASALDRCIAFLMACEEGGEG